MGEDYKSDNFLIDLEEKVKSTDDLLENGILALPPPPKKRLQLDHKLLTKQLLSLSELLDQELAF